MVENDEIEEDAPRAKDRTGVGTTSEACWYITIAEAVTANLATINTTTPDTAAPAKQYLASGCFRCLCLKTLAFDYWTSPMGHRCLQRPANMARRSLFFRLRLTLVQAGGTSSRPRISALERASGKPRIENQFRSKRSS